MEKKKTLSVVLATYNEEKMLRPCLASVRHVADEIVIVDGSSQDNTVSIAKEFDAKIINTTNKPNFHINKQMAIDAAKGDWILQLDADERVSESLAKEIKKCTEMADDEMEQYQQQLPKRQLFLRHKELIEKRDGSIGDKEGSYVAFFLPRRNYFLGRYLLYGGVYPDGVIRLFKKGKAYLPAKDVHEQMVVTGRVGWLKHDLLHYDSPTFQKYLMRWNRYTTLIAMQYREKNQKNTLSFALQQLVFAPTAWFLATFIRHKGFLDGWQGFVFSFFSALRFPASYVKYREEKK